MMFVEVVVSKDNILGDTLEWVFWNSDDSDVQNGTDTE